MHFHASFVRATTLALLASTCTTVAFRNANPSAANAAFGLEARLDDAVLGTRSNVISSLTPRDRLLHGAASLGDVPASRPKALVPRSRKKSVNLPPRLQRLAAEEGQQTMENIRNLNPNGQRGYQNRANMRSRRQQQLSQQGVSAGVVGSSGVGSSGVVAGSGSGSGSGLNPSAMPFNPGARSAPTPAPARPAAQTTGGHDSKLNPTAAAFDPTSRAAALPAQHITTPGQVTQTQTGGLRHFQPPIAQNYSTRTTVVPQSASVPGIPAPVPGVQQSRTGTGVFSPLTGTGYFNPLTGGAGRPQGTGFFQPRGGGTASRGGASRGRPGGNQSRGGGTGTRGG